MEPNRGPPSAGAVDPPRWRERRPRRGRERADGPGRRPSPSRPSAPYYVASRNGAVWTINGATDYGSLGGHPLNAPIVGITSHPTPGLLAGGVRRWDLHLRRRPLLRLHRRRAPQPTHHRDVRTPDGPAYWLYASDGGIFTFGDAHFYGSTGAVHLNQPIVGCRATPDGRGYWLVAGMAGSSPSATPASTDRWAASGSTSR